METALIGGRNRMERAGTGDPVARLSYWLLCGDGDGDDDDDDENLLPQGITN
jgi:hypothetical protein